MKTTVSFKLAIVGVTIALSAFFYLTIISGPHKTTALVVATAGLLLGLLPQSFGVIKIDDQK